MTFPNSITQYDHPNLTILQLPKIQATKLEIHNRIKRLRNGNRKKTVSFNLTMHTFLSFILMTENILHDTIHQTFRKSTQKKVNKYVRRDKAVVRSFSIPHFYPLQQTRLH